jgi:hypothetical protein
VYYFGVASLVKEGEGNWSHVVSRWAAYVAQCAETLCMTAAVVGSPPHPRQSRLVLEDISLEGVDQRGAQ